MAVYIFVPIGTFTYYSNPANYEKSITELYQKYYEPINYDDVDLIEQAKRRIRLKEIEEMKKKYTG